MNDELQRSEGSSISIHTEHGPLHGQLTLVPEACGLIVLTHAGLNPEAHDDMLAVILRQQGFATLMLDLLPQKEERFADAHGNTPLLAKRLLDALDLLKRQMQNETLPTLPLGLCAAGHASPVIVRVAAQRDQDIAAIVCRGGLIDLAGMLYLRSLTSPILVLIGEKDQTLIASNQRALNEVSCTKTLAVIPDSDSNFDSHSALQRISHELSHWFGAHCCLIQQDKTETSM